MLRWRVLCRWTSHSLGRLSSPDRRSRDEQASCRNRSFGASSAALASVVVRFRSLDDDLFVGMQWSFHARDTLAEFTSRNVGLNVDGSVHDPTDPVRLLVNVLAGRSDARRGARLVRMVEGGTTESGTRVRRLRAGQAADESGWRVAPRCLMARGPLIELIGQVAGRLGRQARAAVGGYDMKPVVHTHQRELVTGLILHRDPVCPVAMYVGGHDNSPRVAPLSYSVERASASRDALKDGSAPNRDRIEGPAGQSRLARSGQRDVDAPVTDADTEGAECVLAVHITACRPAAA